NVVVGNPKHLEDRKDLLVQGGLLEPDARMVFDVVLRATVVDVLADPAALQFLGDRLTRDRVAAVTAGDKLAAIKKLMGLITSPDSERLNSFPGRGINEV